MRRTTMSDRTRKQDFMLGTCLGTLTGGNLSGTSLPSVSTGAEAKAEHLVTYIREAHAAGLVVVMKKDFSRIRVLDPDFLDPDEIAELDDGTWLEAEPR